MGADKNPDTEGQLQKSEKWGFSLFTRRTATVLGMTVLVVVTLLFTWRLITLLLVLFLGILLAIFLRGLADHLAKRTPLSPHPALFIVMGALALIIGLSSWAMAPAVSSQAEEIGTMIPEALNELSLWLERTATGRRIISEMAELEVGEFLRGEMLAPLGGAVFGIAGALSHILFVVAVGIYFAYDPRSYQRGIVRMVPLAYRERTEVIINVCTHQLAWWLIGRLLAMAGVAIIVSIGLWILGVPLAGFLGLIAGLFSFVPILGPIVSVVPAALVALTLGPQYILWVGLLYMGAQAVESYVITPMVQHRVVSLPHAMTLIAEVFAGILFGVVGITVATPLAVLVMALVNMIYVEDVLGDETPFTALAEEYG